MNIFEATKAYEAWMAEKLGLLGVGVFKGDLRQARRVHEKIPQKRNWVMPGYEIHIHSRLQRKLRERGIKGPLWENLSKKS